MIAVVSQIAEQSRKDPVLVVHAVSRLSSSKSSMQHAAVMEHRHGRWKPAQLSTTIALYQVISHHSTFSCQLLLQNFQLSTYLSSRGHNGIRDRYYTPNKITRKRAEIKKMTGFAEIVIQ